MSEEAQLKKYEEVNTSSEDVSYHSYLGATGGDLLDMKRMGKVQELRRVYRPWSAFSFVILVQGTWEYLLIATNVGLTNGGLAGLFWSYIWSFVGMGLIAISLAELASMAPTAAGSYHWVSEFAPHRWQKFASHQTGWMAVLAWQTGNTTGIFSVASLIQAMACTAYPNQYDPKGWHITLIITGIAILQLFFTVYASKASPILTNIMLTIHVMGFWLFIVCFWTLSPRNTADIVFTQFSNNGDWTTLGLSLMIGQVSTIFCLTSSDAAAHIAEEIKDAGKTVPQAIVRSYLINGIMGLIVMISFLFCITSLDDALNDKTGYPLFWVLRNMVSDGMLLFLISILVVLVSAGNIALNISTTRQTWAFARDAGFPCYKWLARICPDCETPVNSCIVTCAFTIGLSLINIGSSTGFDAVVSLNIVALLLTYMVSIGSVLYRKLRHPETLPVHRWSLGRWGIPINILALIFSVFIFFWSFWPQDAIVDVTSMNWAVVMLFATIALGLVDYVFRGRRDYCGPATAVDGWKDE